MKSNPVLKETALLVSEPAVRRLWTLQVLTAAAGLFFAIPAEAPGLLPVLGGTPPIFTTAAAAGLLGGMFFLGLFLHYTTARLLEPNQWLKHNSTGTLVFGKGAAAMLLALTGLFTLLPFLLLATVFEGMDKAPALALSLYWASLILFYSLTLLFLELILPDHPVIRRMVLWTLLLLHLLLTPRFVPSLNPFLKIVSLSAETDPWANLWTPADIVYPSVIPPLVLVLVLKYRRKGNQE